MHARLRLYYVQGTEMWADPPDPTKPVTDPREHFKQVQAVQDLKEKLKLHAKRADGRTNDLPCIPGAPMIEERPFSIQLADGVSMSFPVYCGDVHLTSTPALVPHSELERAEGIMWLEKLPDVLEERDPPQENIEKGYRCEKCRRFDLAVGQEWLSRETHQFQEGPEAMHKDILRMVAEGTANATMPNLEEMGYCATRKALVPKRFPGCSEYVERKTWNQ